MVATIPHASGNAKSAIKLRIANSSQNILRSMGFAMRTGIDYSRIGEHGQGRNFVKFDIAPTVRRIGARRQFSQSQ